MWTGTATEGNDVINIRVFNDTGKFECEGVNYDADAFVLNCLGGNDTVSVTQQTTTEEGGIGVVVSLGDGDDIVTGFSAGGGVWCGAGKDYVSYGGSYATSRGEIHGEGGNDKFFIFGHNYEMYVTGDDGNDDIRAGSNYAWVFATGGLGNDFFIPSPIQGDQIYGDEGFDTVYVASSASIYHDDFDSVELFTTQLPGDEVQPPENLYFGGGNNPTIFRQMFSEQPIELLAA
jgi:hypothetical protein